MEVWEEEPGVDEWNVHGGKDGVRLTIVLGDRAVGAAEEIAKVLIESHHHFVLVRFGVPGWYIVAKSGHGAAVEEADSDCLPIAIVRSPSAVEIWYQVDVGDGIARVSVLCLRVQDSSRLVCAVRISRPRIRQGYKVACECQVDQLGDPSQLRAIRGGVCFTDGLICGRQAVGDELVQRKVNMARERQEIALILSKRKVKDGDRKQDERIEGTHDHGEAGAG